MSPTVMVTGGAGFVGSSLCVALAARHPDWSIVAFDSLHRRGSELNLTRLHAGGVRFVHGDVRQAGDLEEAGSFDALVECSAEPSVLAGASGSRDFVIETNLLGAHRCFELAARYGAQVVFLSTSRIYPVVGLEGLALEEHETRFALAADQPLPGASSAGIAEGFPLAGRRTPYGASKLAAELLLGEYDIPWVIDRCGVIAGPWQMGKVDQGVFTHWALSFHLGRPLTYIGYGGRGKQVRDLLHVQDLVLLVDEQLCHPGAWAGATLNVGGGAACSLSLLETTALCRELSGRDVPLGSEAQSRPGDVPVYVSDCSSLFARTAWRPRRTPREILADIFDWIATNERPLRSTL